MWKSSLALLAIFLVPASPVTPANEVQLAHYFVDAHGKYIIPIAIIRNGNLVEPVIYTEPENDKAADRFIRLHYANSSQFQIWQFGQNKGTAVVTGLDNGCNVEFKARPLGIMAVDKSSAAFALSENLSTSHVRYDRSPLDEERASFKEESQRNLARSYPAITSKTRYTIHNSIVTKSRGDGPALLVGSISFIRGGTDYWVFTILERDGQGWKALISQLHRMSDLEYRTDAHYEDFLGQIDINGDGIDEFFTETSYYEGSSYTAYGMKNGKWKRIFEGNYLGC